MFASAKMTVVAAAIAIADWDHRHDTAAGSDAVAGSSEHLELGRTRADNAQHWVADDLFAQTRIVTADCNLHMRPSR